MSQNYRVAPLTATRESLQAATQTGPTKNKHINKVKVKSLSHVRLFVTQWTVAYQAPPSMGFSRQEYWSWLPFPSPGDLPNPWIEPGSPTLEADALTSEPPGKPINKSFLLSDKDSKPGLKLT